MLKKYKNEFLNLIKERQLPITEFIANEYEDDHTEFFELTHRNSKFTFRLRNKSDDYHQFDCQYTLFAPTFPTTEFLPKTTYASFDEIKNYFFYWLDGLKDYLDELLEPDLWKNINEGQKLLNDDNLFEGEAHQFLEEEKEPIRIAINELKMIVSKKFELDEQEKLIVEKRLDYLSASLDRLNKIDWKGLALSSIVGISTALAFDTAKGNALMNVFKEVFSNIIHYLK